MNLHTHKHISVIHHPPLTSVHPTSFHHKYHFFSSLTLTLLLLELEDLEDDLDDDLDDDDLDDDLEDDLDLPAPPLAPLTARPRLLLDERLDDTSRRLLRERERERERDDGRYRDGGEGRRARFLSRLSLRPLFLYMCQYIHVNTQMTIRVYWYT